MKRLITLMLASVFVLGTVASAFAIHTQGRGGAGLDFNARGSWRVVGEVMDNYGFNEDVAEDTYNLKMRARTWFDFTTADGVKAVLGTEIGSARFGETGGLQLGQSPVNIKVKHLYVQFPWPNSDVTISAGKQGVALPAYFSSPILDSDVAGLVVSTPLSDMLGLTLAWLRPYDLAAAGGSDEVDIFAVILPMTLEGMNITPYALYAMIGQDAVGTVAALHYGTLLDDVGAVATDDATAWWAGVNARFTMFDPIYFGFDFIYGTANFELDGDDFDRQGFFFDAAVGMKMDMFTPELFFIYASGDDDDMDKDKRMPKVRPDYVPTSFLFAGSALGAGLGNGDPANLSIMAAGLALKNISFVDKLTHTFRVMYAQGTSDDDSFAVAVAENAMSKDDSLIEFNFDTTYKMFEHLAAIVEIGYIIPDFDIYKGGVDDSAFKLAAGFKYDF